jgi:hypothetical protein
MVPGNDKIGEDDNNKYFGAYFSRRLRPNYHITKYLKENMEHTCPIVGHKTEFHSAVPIEITMLA